MALKALDIYKLLPKKNCKECGDPTCLTFAMKLAAGKADVELCPYLDDNAKNVLGATTRPPIKLVGVGVGERSYSVGEEFVLYRHDKTFYHPPGIMFAVSDTQSEAEIAAVTARVKDETLTRVGADLKFNGTAIVNTSGSAEAYAKAVAAVEKTAGLPRDPCLGEPGGARSCPCPVRDLPPGDLCSDTGELQTALCHSKKARVPARCACANARCPRGTYQKLRGGRGKKPACRSRPADARGFPVPVNGNPAACHHPGLCPISGSRCTSMQQNSLTRTPRFPLGS